MKQWVETGIQLQKPTSVTTLFLHYLSCFSKVSAIVIEQEQMLNNKKKLRKILQKGLHMEEKI